MEIAGQIDMDELSIIEYFIEEIPYSRPLIDLDGVEVNVEFHVAEEGDVLYDVVLGNDILKQEGIFIVGEGVRFRKKTTVVGQNI
ncbi:unnamed protein product [Ceratitis capitata]|uniref:(Mediterranean fruit fly) hypothetical protein n=1 Tax=Ceratitis capitata TaxID=7213 RepID=A0A811UR28_CERCA|nr:unnamed protein product [Ceratitis capitata]CAD7001161.1 unnamed protein product [Ceratitis capitata]